MSNKLRYVIGAADGVVFIDLLIMGIKICDGSYDLIAEGIVGLVGFAVIGCCGAFGLYRELRRHRSNGFFPAYGGEKADNTAARKKQNGLNQCFLKKRARKKKG